MIMLTGASGYIGKALLQRLIALDREVVTAGRVSIAENIEHRPLDLLTATLDRDLFSGVDTVIHCAGVAHNRGTVDDYRRINVDATIALGQSAVASDCRHFIFLSSLNVVPVTSGDAAASPHDLPKPASAYAESKWHAERQLIQCFAHSGCDLTIVRSSLVYDRQLVANLDLLQRLTRWLPVALPDAGSRMMIARPDLVDLLALLAHRPRSPAADLTQADSASTVRIIVAADGERYMSKRIGSALASRAQIPVPQMCWRLFCPLWDVLRGVPAGTTWAAVGSDHWVGAVDSPEDWQPRYTLEALLAPGRY
ncbi:UDP-N-acetyl-D-quinovosamine 4-epimerase, putative [Luminiphilus syltensis NOR5-1B]|uniref:UDP-N-acetyl-D-quinovosamine 4-epimerase, putative n=1 Tax=Luminiphilus syltensis NOR5-1B TaxID=565045 RepID=B8KX37_9GAMM|nr:NAD-dependent epimerase/dehydratase family protein [Luminiphilus syltensis]EED35994.1 UDP-N-acetyl-D-quinovosamine 4-epimerase, putative [Luminiphilus syltensis NOR5-1B]